MKPARCSHPSRANELPSNIQTGVADQKMAERRRNMRPGRGVRVNERSNAQVAFD
jgi:hypothetical protein